MLRQSGVGGAGPATPTHPPPSSSSSPPLSLSPPPPSLPPPPLPPPPSLVRSRRRLWAVSSGPRDGCGPGGQPGRVDTQAMVEEHGELAAYFEKWYADMTGASVQDEIQQRHLGLPPELLSTSLLTWHGIAEVAEALELDALSCSSTSHADAAATGWNSPPVHRPECSASTSLPQLSRRLAS